MPMILQTCRAACLALSLSLAAPLAAQTDVAPEGENAAQAVAFGEQLAAMLAQPQDYDHAALTEQFIASADLPTSHQAYAVIDAFADGFAPTDAECSLHAEALQRSLQQVPISPALHLLAAGCSDSDERALAHLAAARGVLRMGSHPMIGKSAQIPYRVFAKPDAQVLPALLGLELLTLGWAGPDSDSLEVLPWHLLVREADKPEARSHFLYVDGFDLVARMAERAQAPAHPLLRYQLMVEFMASGLQPDQPFDPLTRSADAVAALMGGDIDEATARKSILEVREYDPGAVAGWVYLCQIHAAIEACPNEDIDLLLDDAESGYPVALATLAIAHLRGRQVDVDLPRAEAFLDLLLSKHDPVSTLGMTTRMLLPLLTAGDADNAATQAFVQRLIRELRAVPDEDGRSRALLGVLALNGQHLEGEQVEGRLWFRQAEEAGWLPARIMRIDGKDSAERQAYITEVEPQLAYWAFPPARTMLAAALLDEGREDQAMAHLERAARAGSPMALRLYVTRALLQDPTPEQLEIAEGTLLALVSMNDERAALQLIKTRLEHPEPAREPLPEALLGLLAQYVEQSRDPALRLLYSRALIAGVAGSADFKAGLRQLRSAQRGGSSWAYLYEYELASEGKLGKPRQRKLQKLLRNALDAPDASTEVQLRVARIWASDPESTASQQAAAITLLRQAQTSSGEAYLLNDLAWTLCLDNQAERGLPLAEAAVENERDGRTVDTLAACHAALGDFASAIGLQEDALRLSESTDEETQATLEAMRDRLQAYREGRADFGE